jgi:hypothetical protein
MHGYFLLGNNFLNIYLPTNIFQRYIALTLKTELVHTPLLEQRKCYKDFVPTKHGDITHSIKTLDESHLMQLLEDCNEPRYLRVINCK